MAIFLAPLMDEINSLSKGELQATYMPSTSDLTINLYIGFCVTTPDGREITVRAKLLLCSVDLPAKAILNMKQFNGQNGCSFCKDPGVPSHHHTYFAIGPTPSPVLQGHTRA